MASAFSMVPLMAAVGVSHHCSFLQALLLAAVFSVGGWLFCGLYSFLGYKLFGLDTSKTIHLNTFVLYLYAPLFLTVAIKYNLFNLASSGMVANIVGGTILFVLSLGSYFHADKRTSMNHILES